MKGACEQCAQMRERLAGVRAERASRPEEQRAEYDRTEAAWERAIRQHWDSVHR
ncbi:hypothetical protein AB0A05_26895 [Streptomyces sp. NPDC046374]|uniref:hypothetical protein n=1 Tax=Streptomyces sp. NPDC046374 TaxID=3154917 RepID=UPI0033BFE293